MPASVKRLSATRLSASTTARTSAPTSATTRAVCTIASSSTRSLTRSTQPTQSPRPVATTSVRAVPAACDPVRRTSRPRTWRSSASAAASARSRPSVSRCSRISARTSGSYRSSAIRALTRACAARTAFPTVSGPAIARGRSNRFSTLNVPIRTVAIVGSLARSGTRGGCMTRTGSTRREGRGRCPGRRRARGRRAARPARARPARPVSPPPAGQTVTGRARRPVSRQRLRGAGADG